MIKLLGVFGASLIFAYLSEQHTRATLASGRRYSVWNDWAYLLLVAVLSLFSGLRTSYNDTWNYISGFRSAPLLSGFLSNPANWNPFKNPLFYFYQSLLKSLVNNAQLLIFTAALFTQSCFIWLIKKYSKNFTFSIFIYFTLGTFLFTLAAIKQVLAMAVLALATPSLEQKNWPKYFFVVLIAMLFHTYAIAFAVLPFFMVRPWRKFTFLFVAAVVVTMLNFQEAISGFMDQANDLGKTLADYEVFDNNTVNIFRVAVYAIPPLLSFAFQKWVFRNSTSMDHVFIHMSIISLSFMIMGTQSGANMFARMAMYFELGTIFCLPQMLEKTFNRQSYRLMTSVAAVCFFAFFMYANAIAGDFGGDYRWIFS